MIRNDTFHNYNLLKFVKTCFVAYHVVCLRGCVRLGGMYVLLFLVDCSVHVCGVQLVYSTIQILSVLANIHSGCSFIIESGALKSLSIILNTHARKPENSKCWQGYGEIGTLVHFL